MPRPPPPTIGGGTAGGGGVDTIGGGTASTTGSTQPGCAGAACTAAALAAPATAAEVPHKAARDACVPNALSAVHGLIEAADGTVDAAVAGEETSSETPAISAAMRLGRDSGMQPLLEALKS